MTDIRCENYTCKYMDECGFCGKKSITIKYNKFIISGICSDYEKSSEED